MVPSKESSLIRVHSICYHGKIYSHKKQNDNIFRTKKIGKIRVKVLLESLEGLEIEPVTCFISTFATISYFFSRNTETESCERPG